MEERISHENDVWRLFRLLAEEISVPSDLKDKIQNLIFDQEENK